MKPIVFEPITSWLVLIVIFVVLFTGLVLITIKSGKQHRKRWYRRGVMLLITALMAFQPMMLGGVAQKGMTLLDVYFVVDLSPSVVAEDYNGQQTRLSGIQSDIKALATKQAGARFSLISFDTSGQILSPLTTDASALLAASDTMQPAIINYTAGSSIDSGLSTLREQLESAKKSNPERKRVVYYMGDGEQTVDKAPASFASIKDLINGGAVLGYGTEQGGRMEEHYVYTTDDSKRYISDPDYTHYDPVTFKPLDALSKIDETALRKIASEIGVEYFHRTKPDDTSELAQEINIDKIATDSYDRNSFVELYWILATVLVILSIWELISLMNEITIARYKPKGVS